MKGRRPSEGGKRSGSPSEWTWDHHALWEIHQAISQLAGHDRPQIRVFHGQIPSDLPPSDWFVFSSSFNPPTEAHAQIISKVFASFRFSSALLLLDLDHADKQIREAVLEDRALMSKIRFFSDPRVALGICTHGRFLDKLEALEALCPVKAQWNFALGMDTFQRVLDPHFYEHPESALASLFHRAKFLVSCRNGADESTVDRALRTYRQARIIRLHLSRRLQPLSSSEVRRRAARRERLYPLVAPEIERFILETGLYRPSTIYSARRRVLRVLFQEGPERFEDMNMHERTRALCHSRQI